MRLKNIYVVLFFAIIIFITLCTGICYGKEKKASRDFEFKLKGQATSLWVFSNQKITGIGNTINNSRLRLDFDIFYRKKWNLKVIYDLEGFTGNMINSILWDQLKNNQVNSYWNLSSGSKLGRASYLRNTIYRICLNYETKFARFSLGKQRVAWGVMRFLKPTDLFNPESPLQVEAGERVGIDALKVNIPLSKKGDIEALAAPSRLPDGTVSAAKLRYTVGNYDLNFLKGRVQGNNVTGYSFDGYVGDGGFRGELVQIRPRNRAAYTQWAIGGDYSFRNNLTLTLEYLYNGGATGIPVDPLLPYQGILQTQNKQFVEIGIIKQISPLLNGNLFTSYDIEGGTIAVSPRISWDFKQNIEISAGTTIFKGKTSGEYSFQPDALFGQVKFYF